MAPGFERGEQGGWGPIENTTTTLLILLLIALLLSGVVGFFVGLSAVALGLIGFAATISCMAFFASILKEGGGSPAWNATILFFLLGVLVGGLIAGPLPTPSLGALGPRLSGLASILIPIVLCRFCLGLIKEGYPPTIQHFADRVFGRGRNQR